MPRVLVTGASSGIGEAFARQYAADGWQVIATVRDQASADALAAQGIDVRRLDMRDFEGIDALGRDVADLAIDVAIANAGIYEGPDLSLADTDPVWWLDAFRINTVAPVLLARALVGPVRRSQGRTLVAISSLLGSLTLNRQAGHYAYRSSKAALNAAWRGLSVELPDVISVLFRPGRVRTAMGGADAPLSPDESVGALRRVIGGLTLADSGRFIDYMGQDTAW